MNEMVLLINPAINPKSQSTVINRIINKTFPTSIGVLAGYLFGSGIESVGIIDEQIDYIDDVTLKDLILSMQKPKIIGLSVLTVNSKRAYELSDLIKKIDSEVLIVLGGIHPTVLPDEALKHESVDVAVRGEGEETFRDLIKCVLNQQDYREIRGISYRKNGSIMHNPDRPLIANLDEIPPFPYYLFDKYVEKYPTFGVVFTSRGCPYGCTFCSSRSVSGRRYRYFSIERVASEVKLLVDKYGQKSIWLMDDNIAANRKHFMLLLDTIIKAGLHKKAAFHGSMRGDNMSEEILEMAKAANFKMIAFGLETGSESLMKLIDKGETVEQVAEAIRMTDRKGIATATTIIFGLPTETRKDRWDCIKLVRSLPLSSVRFNTLVPYPGTPSFEELNRLGKLHIKDNWENFAVQYMWEGDDLPYVPEGCSRYDLMFDTMFANLSFYLSPKGVWMMLKSSYAGGNVIHLSGRWFLIPGTVWKIFKVFLYLIRRFIYVTFKMITEKFYRKLFFI